MATMTIEYHSEAERVGLELAIAYFSDLNRMAQTAPDGTVLAACEKVALEKGRDLLRSTLTAALEGRIASAERKGGPPAPAPRRTPDAPRVAADGRS